MIKGHLESTGLILRNNAFKPFHILKLGINLLFFYFKFYSKIVMKECLY